MGKIYVPDTADRTADAVVVGGGIVGVATAFWLSKAGLETILVEIRDGLSTLTTAASIESFRAQFTEPAMAALARESIEVWENFAEVVGIPDYRLPPEVLDREIAVIEEHDVRAGLPGDSFADRAMADVHVHRVLVCMRVDVVAPAVIFMCHGVSPLVVLDCSQRRIALNTSGWSRRSCTRDCRPEHRR
jgi:NADPH-dependent 2,4-dienoyl-CoA reductase/sulfur reductase-like enzyme